MSTVSRGRQLCTRRRARASAVTYTEMFHCFDKPPRSSCGLWGGIIKLEPFEISKTCQHQQPSIKKTNRGRATHLAAALPPLLVDILFTVWTRWPSILDPMTASIIARCSRLSCVWNRASPVKNSTRIHPMLQISQGKDHPSPRMISGAR